MAVPEAEVRTFQRAEAAGVFDLTSSAANFRQGDEVEIEAARSVSGIGGQDQIGKGQAQGRDPAGYPDHVD